MPFHARRYERISEVLGNRSETVDLHLTPARVWRFKGRPFVNVNFSYRPDLPVQNLSFKIEPGQVAAFVNNLSR